jgi:hypothetical protein
MFLLSMVLVICLSTCHIVKRKAPDGQLYVISDRKGCESVQSQAPCTVTWKLNSDKARVYKQLNELVALVIKLYNVTGHTSICIQVVQKSLCSQIIPKCSAVDGTRDYGNTQEQCEEAYRVCQDDVVARLKNGSFCQRLKTGKHPISRCVAPSTPVTGACPQPKFKVSINIYLLLYDILNLNFVQGRSLTDNRELKHVGRQHEGDGQNKFLQINDSKENLSYIIIRMNLIQYKKLKTVALCLGRVLLTEF